MSSAYHPETDGQTERVNQQVECFSRCFISAHPTKWSKWLSSCEFWYNTNWHSSLNKTPFEVLYGQHPTYFGLSANSAVARVDVQQWLDQRKVILASVRQHLLRASQRMKLQADKKCTERSFQVGDMVFLKLQPYVQTSVVHRSNHKLAFRFYGPYQVLEKIGTVTYRLALPATSRIHPIFHVSQLKQCLSPKHQVQSALPTDSASLQIPVCVLQRRLSQRGSHSVLQGLIRWSGVPETEATWEDLDSLRQEFPRAPAWGQAASEEGGGVSDLDMDHKSNATPGPSPRPTRAHRLPARAGREWFR